MSNLEGTDSKLRNQILETPETYEASEKKSNDSDERKTRNQILDKFESYKSSEEDEKLDNDDSKENSKEATGKDDRPKWQQVRDSLKKDDSDDKKRTSEIDNKPESKKENTEDKQPEFSQRGETKTTDVPDKKKNNETGNNGDDGDDMTISDALGDGRKSGMLVESDIEEAKGLEQRYNEDIIDIPPDGKKMSKDQRKELEYVRTTNDKYIDLISDKRYNMSVALVAAEEGMQNKLDEIRHYRETSTDDKDTRERIEEKLNDEYEGMKSTAKTMKEKIKEADYHITKLKDNNREIDKIL